MATIKKTIDVSSNLSEKQIKMLEQATKAPLTYDKDNPFLTKE